MELKPLVPGLLFSLGIYALKGAAGLYAGGAGETVESRIPGDCSAFSRVPDKLKNIKQGGKELCVEIISG